jgi:hypothetical protein
MFPRSISHEIPRESTKKDISQLQNQINDISKQNEKFIQNP